MRITMKDDGTYTVPDGNLFAPGRTRPDPRSTRWASATLPVLGRQDHGLRAPR
ncbi:hypothetical protein NKG05_22470 [Oerskovia sp. M15]